MKPLEVRPTSGGQFKPGAVQYPYTGAAIGIAQRLAHGLDATAIAFASLAVSLKPKIESILAWIQYGALDRSPGFAHGRHIAFSQLLGGRGARNR